MVSRLVGLQAQSAQSPYVSLAARVLDFDPSSLSSMLADRLAVRMALQRGTLHLVTAEDALALRPLLDPVLERGLRTGSPFGKQLAFADLPAIVAAGLGLLTEKPQTLAALRPQLGRLFPDADEKAMSYAVHYRVPLVQVPPRGLFQQSGLPVVEPLERFLGKPLGKGMPVQTLLERYLAAFGPASAADAQAWSGLTGLSRVLAKMDLVTFEDEHGRVLHDLPSAPRPSPETPAPPRFLPDFDNVFLGHADRSRILTEDYRALVPPQGSPPAVLLVDGFVSATWRLEDEVLAVRSVRAFTPSERKAITAEAQTLFTLWKRTPTPLRFDPAGTPPRTGTRKPRSPP